MIENEKNTVLFLHIPYLPYTSTRNKLVTNFRNILSFINLYRHTLFTPLYATRGSLEPGNI